MTSAADHYATLGVAPQADLAAIRAAYRNLMRRYHPDVNPSVDAAAKAIAINEAYACLSDADARAAYDECRASDEKPNATARPYRPHRPDWSAYPAFSPVPEPDPPSVSVRMAMVGLAVLVTLVTFALTSAVSLPGPPPPTLMTDEHP